MSVLKIFAVLSALLVLFLNPASAGKLPFPQTRQQWVKALSITTAHKPPVEKGRFGGKGITVVTTHCPCAGSLVLFDFNSAAVRSDANPALDALAEALQNEFINATLKVEGHTDDRGSDKYNLTLSKQRAAAVRDYLVSNHGISSQRLPIGGYGEARKIESNATEAGRALNRRVEFTNVCN